MKKLAGWALLMLMLVVVAGCGGKTETQGPKVEVSGNKIEVQNERGKGEISMGNEGEVSLPEGYPVDVVPIMEGAKITTATKVEDGSYSVLLTSGGSVSEISQYYQEVLGQVSDFQKQDVGGAVSMMGTKDGKTFVINISEDAASGINQRVIGITIIPAE